jgi:hypothetical protein
MKELVMKTNIFVAALLLLCLGCTSQESKQLTQQQKDQIKSEVKAVGDSIIAKWVGLDAGGSQYYSDSPDWVMFNADGTQYDFQTFKKVWIDLNNSVTAIKWTTTRQDFIFVTKDIVICAWVGKDETILKSGDKITYDPHAYTMVFKKIAGQWKAIYSHDSGIAVTQKAGKK